MNGQNQSAFYRMIRPYLFISLVGILAFAPVSFMLNTLKNDIVAIEYPINYFISQCLHNGEIPYWFNTWGMGFPLQSNLTWGIYSTPQILFSSLFNYNIYVLHAEFIFFVLLSGWGMFYLLKKHLVKDQKLAQVLAICYMLSGFTTGSSQWLLYITAAAFIPLVISSLLQLLNSPSSRNALQFALVYFMMFTSVYAAFSIITSYCIVFFLLIWFLKLKKDKAEKLKTLRFIVLAAALTTLFCAPCLFYSIELLKYMERGNAIANPEFFNSNYLHPASSISALFPFSSVRMDFANTEGTMLDLYTGLFTLLFLPVAIRQTIKEKNRAGFFLLVSALFFLLLSFGAMTPLRNALNILPGFSYFRNPGIFRLYFILSLILYLGLTFRDTLWNVFFTSSKQVPILKITFFALLLICLITLFSNIKSAEGLSFDSIAQLIKSLTFGQALFINSLIQLILLLVLFFAVFYRHFRFAGIVFAADLIINTLICTPYFTVSSYSLPAASQILHSEKGFPVQNEKINVAASIFTDEKMNTWYNTNVYTKQVTSNDSYRGPLTLRQFSRHLNGSDSAMGLLDHAIAFAGVDSVRSDSKVTVILQKPTHLRLSVSLPVANTVTVMQNYFPGWRAFYNDSAVEFINKDKPGLTIAVPSGKGIIDLSYEKKGVWLSALILHLITISFFAFQFFRFMKRKFLKPSSLS